MTVFCTYCTYKKNQSSIPTPAVELYNSKRIDSCYKAAKHLGLPFYILSGKYGLLDAVENISYYDHLLIEKEVEDHAKIVAKQIQNNNIARIVFFQVPTSSDNKTYIDCITLATEISNIKLTMIDITIPE